MEKGAWGLVGEEGVTLQAHGGDLPTCSGALLCVCSLT